MQCINPKKYALTKGKEYKVIYEKDNVITVVNDNGGAANYSKSLFAETVEASIPALAPVPVFSYSVNVQHVNDTQIRVTITTSNPNNTYTFNLDKDSTIISCGVHQLSGMNSLSEIVDRLPQNVRQEALDSIFESILMDFSAAFVVVSTNISDDNTTIRTWLDSNCSFSSDEATNPNSENQIKVWGLEVLEV